MREKTPHRGRGKPKQVGQAEKFILLIPYLLIFYCPAQSHAPRKFSQLGSLTCIHQKVKELPQSGEN